MGGEGEEAFLAIQLPYAVRKMPGLKTQKHITGSSVQVGTESLPAAALRSTFPQ